MTNNFTRSFGKTCKAVERASQKLKAYQQLMRHNAPVDPKKLEETIYYLENATLEARKLYGYDIAIDNQQAYIMRQESVSHIFPLTVDIKPETVYIKMPNVVSKKSKTTYMRDSLNIALGNQIEAPLDRENVVVSFVYHFAENIRMFDYDNLETRSILNVLTKFIIKDDSPKQINMYQSAAFDGETCTEIFIESKDAFLKRLLSQKSIPP